jgi:hypothetical protein
LQNLLQMEDQLTGIARHRVIVSVGASVGWERT